MQTDPEVVEPLASAWKLPKLITNFVELMETSCGGTLDIVVITRPSMFLAQSGLDLVYSRTCGSRGHTEGEKERSW